MTSRRDLSVDLVVSGSDPVELDAWIERYLAEIVRIEGLPTDSTYVRPADRMGREPIQRRG